MLDISELPDAGHAALFLDFDGTLVEIAEEPDAVRLDPVTRETLARLSVGLGGALAIVSGREIAAIDRLLAPLRLPVAGAHGLVRRDSRGCLHEEPSGSNVPLEIRRHLELQAASVPGVLVEHKSTGVALHYRQRPDASAVCHAAVAEAIAPYPAFEIKHGKMVLEVKARGCDKGTAIAAFMQEAPFEGRRAIVAGDDVTDEDAFAIVNRLGGITIKVGGGETLARHRIASTADFLDWLGGVAARWIRREDG